jgi:hypothetical protein
MKYWLYYFVQEHFYISQVLIKQTQKFKQAFQISPKVSLHIFFK